MMSLVSLLQKVSPASTHWLSLGSKTKPVHLTNEVKTCVCVSPGGQLRARWSLFRSLAASSTSSKCGGCAHSPALRSVSRVPMFCMACISSTCAMRVRTGIMTGFHLQSLCTGIRIIQ